MNFTKINELKPYDLNCNIFDVYSYDGLTMQELLCQFFTKINECIKTSNETIDLTEWLVNEGIKEEVAIKLNNCLNDGTFENLINVTLFENINKKIDNVNTQLEHNVNVIRSEINNLVLESGGDSNLEVIQARNNHQTLNDRLNNYDLLMDNNTYYENIEYKEFNNTGYYEEDGKCVSYHSPSYNSVEITVTNIKELRLSTRLKGDWYGIIFTDENNNVLKKELYSPNSVTIFEEFISKVPLGAFKVFVNSYKVDDDVYKIKCEKKSFKQKVDYNEYENYKLINNLKGTIETINRLGYDPYNMQTPPEQSLESYKLAYKNGFRIMLCDVRTTSDGKLVCIHDKTINSVARNLDGTKISSNININDISLKDCSKYDFGILKGEQYKNTKILQLEDMVMFCKKTNCELYIELKEDLTELQYIELSNIIKLYGMENHTTIVGDYNQRTSLKGINNLLLKSRFGFICNDVTSSNISFAKTLLKDTNEVFLFVWDTTEITKEGIELCLENNIKIEAGTLNSKNDIIEYYSNKNNLFVNRMESEKFIIENVLLESLFNL